MGLVASVKDCIRDNLPILSSVLEDLKISMGIEIVVPYRVETTKEGLQAHQVEKAGISYRCPEVLHFPEPIRIIHGRRSTDLGARHSFIRCPSLEMKIDSYIKRISEKAFAWNKVLSISFNSAVEIIEKRVFEFSSLQYLVLPKGLKVVHDKAFQFCYELSCIVFPDSVEYIGEKILAGSSVRFIIFEGDISK